MSAMVTFSIRCRSSETFASTPYIDIAGRRRKKKAGYICYHFKRLAYPQHGHYHVKDRLVKPITVRDDGPTSRRIIQNSF